MAVRDFCQSNPVTIEPGETAREAAKRLEESGVGSLVVVDSKGRPAGVVTDRDIAVRLVRRRLDPDATPVSDIMSEDVTYIRGDAPLVLAMRRMRVDGLRRVPVISDDGRLVGILSWDDAIQVVAEEMKGAAAVARAQMPSAAAAG